MVIREIIRYGGTPELVEAVRSTGIKRLYPPQAMAVESGLLNTADSFVVAAATASGKTLIAELCALGVFFGGTGKTVYLVPLRALAGEKYEDFSRKYTALGLKVAHSTGDYDSPEPWLRSSDVIIATNEKFDSLVRHEAPWLGEVRLIVADEIHLLGDPRRGPTLEVVLTRLRALNPARRIIALSATITNAPDISGWLGARLVESSWRPVPLREGVYSRGAGIFGDGSVRWIEESTGAEEVDIAIDTIKGSGQALVFVNTRKAAEAAAHKALSPVSSTLSKKERAFLKGLADKVLNASAEPTRLCRKLAECVSSGVAFHHAGVRHSQRKLVEDAFRANRIKLVTATTTLAMGLNLPSRTVVIRDWRRYESGLGMLPIPVMEVKQMSGRAGRPGYDEYGEALIVARSRKDERFLFDTYVRGSPEDVSSQLGSEPALRAHVLALIAGGLARSRAELSGFLGKTFFASLHGEGTITGVASGIVDFLVAEGLVGSVKDALLPTRFGRRVAELYIDPLTGVILRDALSMDKEKGDFALLHMIARTPDMAPASLRRKDYDHMVEVFYKNRDELLLPPEEAYPTEELLRELKAASVLLDWIGETGEDAIVGRYDIGPGDLRTLIELGDWLLYSAGEVGRVFRLKEEAKLLSRLRVRVRYGVKEELLELVTLKGVGRVRARNLFDAGFRGIREIREATAAELAKVPFIGKTVARDILARAMEGAEAHATVVREGRVKG